MTDFRAYHAALKDREPRPFFLEALSYIDLQKPEPKAIDLGFGDGAEVLHLLSLGWQVRAIDKEATAVRGLLHRLEPEARQHLRIMVSTFTNADLGQADFIYAGLSLPYLNPQDFEKVWHKIEAALSPGAYFAGHFFGRSNETSTQAMTSHSEADLLDLFRGFELILFRELTEEAESALGVLRHWHYFEVFAKKK